MQIALFFSGKMWNSKKQLPQLYPQNCYGLKLLHCKIQFKLAILLFFCEEGRDGVDFIVHEFCGVGDSGDFCTSIVKLHEFVI